MTKPPAPPIPKPDGGSTLVSSRLSSRAEFLNRISPKTMLSPSVAVVRPLPHGSLARAWIKQSSTVSETSSGDLPSNAARSSDVSDAIP